LRRDYVVAVLLESSGKDRETCPFTVTSFEAIVRGDRDLVTVGSGSDSELRRLDAVPGGRPRRVTVDEESIAGIIGWAWPERTNRSAIAGSRSLGAL